MPPMKLRILRRERPGEATIGELYLDGEYFCWTLEDVVRAQKIQDRTAIPAGTYKVVLNFSNRFQRKMPLVLNVPDFSGIRIHGGNTHLDTKGCPLVGFDRRGAQIAHSQDAFQALMDKLEEAEARQEDIWLEVIQPDAWPKWQQRVTVSVAASEITMEGVTPLPAPAPVVSVTPAAPPLVARAVEAAPPPSISMPVHVVAPPAPNPPPPRIPVSRPDDEPIRVIGDEGTARGSHFLTQVLTVAAGAWAYFENNPRLLIIMAVVLIAVTVAWFYRSTVLNREKMRINSDPHLYNVD